MSPVATAVALSVAMMMTLAAPAAALAAVATTALAVQPVAVNTDGADGMYWRVWKPGHRALVVVRATDQGADIKGAIRGLKVGAQYRIVGTNSDGDCSSRVTAANRTFQFTVDSRPEITWIVGSANGGIWKTTGFIRIREVGGADWACHRVSPFEVGEGPSDGGLAMFVSGDGTVRGITLVEVLVAARARVTVAVGDINGDGLDLQIRGSTAACGARGATLFKLQLEDVVGRSFTTRVVDMTQEELESLESIRIKALTGGSAQGGFFRECRSSVLIGLLLP